MAPASKLYLSGIEIGAVKRGERSMKTPNCTLVELKERMKDHKTEVRYPPNCTLVELK